MQPLGAAEIRRRFVEFFKRNGHTHVPSSSLVPKDDPTLLFTNAGMVQFKDVFTGKERLPFRRAVTAQKCVRAGGKHNDLDNVGFTARHHTFFEMLGNFSFGDYFKREAIGFAWTFLTQELGLPAERLYATIYRDDDEAFRLWQEVAGLPPERIIRLGEKDNFWAMGDTGPCGPCSEVVIDRGEEFRCDAPECFIGQCDCDRFLELWNLVFMQFERHADGRMEPLPRPSIDTGMGLERIASVLQGVSSNFDTDLFTPIIRRVEELSGRRYDRGADGFPFRVIADHARACTFLIADGVFPSNEFRGYVLRRILRRAVRFGTLLGLDEPFLFRLVGTVVEVMGEAYPELHERREYVEQVIRLEEERFHRTLAQGSALLEEMIARAEREGRGRLSGDDAFVLYDTYGFPIDLMEDAARERGLAVDREGFERRLEEQRERARRAREDAIEQAPDSPLVQALEGVPPTEFVGYERLRVEAQVLAVVAPDGARPDVAAAGDDRVAVLLDRTPFYAEGGGQVGDAGEIVTPTGRFRVEDTKPFYGARRLHWGRVVEGRVEAGQRGEAAVDATRRWSTMRNHTATHLLHRALKDVLGEHVNQAGSLVAPDRLRFDFTHFAPLSAEELRRIEDRVNEQVLRALPVEAFLTSLREAREAGAVALFGEKYGDTVRVVRMGDYSMELCGGTHLENTAQVGLFKIVAEGSVGAGVRRVEAVTGTGALAYVRELEERLARAAEMLRCAPEDVVERVSDAVGERRALQRELEGLRQQLARQVGEQLAGSAEAVGGFRLVVGRVPLPGAEALRSVGDALRDRIGSGVVLLGGVDGDRVQLLAVVTRDLVGRGLHAGRLVGEVARVAGGGGGGRPDMAQAGGRDPSRLDEALAHGRRLALEALRGLAEAGAGTE